MSTPSRNASARNIVASQRTFFVETNCWGGRFLLQSDASAELLVDVLFRYRDSGLYRLHDFVVMPNHFHALITIVDDTAVEEVIGRIKGRFSYRRHRELGRAGDFWQPGLSDKRVRTRAEFLAYRKYIWMNPVEAGLVASPELWPWSTANPRFHKAHAAGA